MAMRSLRRFMSSNVWTVTLARRVMAMSLAPQRGHVELGVHDRLAQTRQQVDEVALVVDEVHRVGVDNQQRAGGIVEKVVIERLVQGVEIVARERALGGVAAGLNAVEQHGC